MPPRISLIVACDEYNCIGRNGEVPWHIPLDLRRFKQLTLGKPVIMGRKTWDSLPEDRKPLQGRTNIVISRSHDLYIPSALRTDSLEAALGRCFGSEHVFVIGGGEIYKEALPLASDVYMTRVHIAVSGGDTFFPTLPESFQLRYKEYTRAEGVTPSHTLGFWVK